MNETTPRCPWPNGVCCFAGEVVDARALLDQALSCILDETPEDMSREEARQDTIEKIRSALNGKRIY